LEDAVKIKSLSEVRLEAMRNIIHTASMISYKQYKFFKQFHLSPQQFNILRILRDARPESLTFQSIRERMLEKTPHTTRMIDKLEKSGLVFRERSLDDRRKIYVHISDQGLASLKKIEKKFTDLMTQMDNLNAEEARQLSELLRKYRE